MIEYAVDAEIEERRWNEWVVAAPVAAIGGTQLPYRPYRRKKEKRATENTITNIAKAFGLDLEEIKSRGGKENTDGSINI